MYATCGSISTEAPATPTLKIPPLRSGAAPASWALPMRKAPVASMAAASHGRLGIVLS